MSLRGTLGAGALVLGLVLAVLLVTRQSGFGRWRFVLEDENDRSVYQQRGRWLPGGRTPYLEEHSEYPQLATWFFGLPYLWFDSAVPEGRAQTPAEFRNEVADQRSYLDLHQVHMGLLLFALLLLTASNLERLGSRPASALLLLLPSCLYFGFNRFDALPAVLVAGALACQLRGRRLGAAFLLALGGMTKWWPALLLPLFAAHNVWSEREAAERRGEKPPPLGPSLLRGVLFPGLVAFGTCLALLAITWLWDGGGLEAVLHPYRHHEQRDPNLSSLVTQLTDPARWGLLPASAQAGTTQALTLLQFLPALLVALLPIRTPRALFAGSLLVTGSFIVFCKIFSPQWILWLLPAAIPLAASSRTALFLFVALDLSTYVQMPLLYYASVAAGGADPRAFFRACTLRTLVLLALWAWSCAALLRAVRRRA